MKVSVAGRELITRNEGLKLEAYPDPATGGDPWTIGYGDTGPDVIPGLRITREEAIRRLDDRLAREFGAAVNKGIGDAPTTQGQFDAMVSLAYNIGVGGFRGSSVLRKHLAGDHEGAANAFLLWNKAAGHVLSGLTRRRKEERALYLSAIPEAPAAEPASDPAVVEDDGKEMLAATIRVVQLHMKLYGWYEGEVDGIWGRESNEAALEMQRR